MKRQAVILSVFLSLLVTGCSPGIDIDVIMPEAGQMVVDDDTSYESNRETATEEVAETVDAVSDTSQDPYVSTVADNDWWEEYNLEAKNDFKDFLNAPEIIIYDWQGEPAYVIGENEKDSVEVSYMEIGKNHTPLLFLSSYVFYHALGYCHVFQYLDGEVTYVTGLDGVDVVYADSGIVVLTHQGGGYGEIDRYYFVLDDNDELVMLARTSIMEDTEYADAYIENFGENFPDTYYFTDPDADEYEDVEITKEEFEDWLNGLTFDEQHMTEVVWDSISGL